MGNQYYLHRGLLDAALCLLVVTSYKGEALFWVTVSRVGSTCLTHILWHCADCWIDSSERSRITYFVTLLEKLLNEKASSLGNQFHYTSSKTLQSISMPTEQWPQHGEHFTCSFFRRRTAKANTHSFITSHSQRTIKHNANTMTTIIVIVLKERKMGHRENQCVEATCSTANSTCIEVRRIDKIAKMKRMGHKRSRNNPRIVPGYVRSETFEERMVRIC
jgi:hypothetical protein